MGVFTRLADFDGKSIASLEAIMRSTEPTHDLLGELVEISGSEDADMQIGATWLLRAYLQAGAHLTPPQVERFSVLLSAVQDGFACLHVCQFMHLLQVPSGLSETFAMFFRECLGSRNTFVRAWAPSGFWQLAAQHPDYEEEARGWIEKALTDPAPSVRARARRTLAGE